MSILPRIIVLAAAAAACRTSSDCAEGSLCVRGTCKVMWTWAPASRVAARTLPDACLDTPWPNVSNCVVWTENSTTRWAESNNVPPYYVAPYCPYGLGEGYCGSPTEGDSTDCAPFQGMRCPCSTNDDDGADCPDGSPTTGDVMVASYQLFEFARFPDPTSAAKPKHMYADPALVNGNTYQVIGAHLNGVQIKGPAEANGYNVDTSLIPLPCGGHVTPPVGPGPVYHYHKAADCVEIETAGAHGPLLGFASDGFGIYGYGDAAGAPVLDECHGHFGPVPEGGDAKEGDVVYHYHASGATNIDGAAHRPYYLGCQGPSKGRCAATVSDDYDGGANWCGAGCGAELCVQPGTNRTALEAYIDAYSPGWLENFTMNDFE